MPAPAAPGLRLLHATDTTLAVQWVAWGCGGGAAAASSPPHPLPPPQVDFYASGLTSFLARWTPASGFPGLGPEAQEDLWRAEAAPLAAQTTTPLRWDRGGGGGGADSPASTTTGPTRPAAAAAATTFTLTGLAPGRQYVVRVTVAADDTGRSAAAAAAAAGAATPLTATPLTAAFSTLTGAEEEARRAAALERADRLRRSEASFRARAAAAAASAAGGGRGGAGAGAGAGSMAWGRPIFSPPRASTATRPPPLRGPATETTSDEGDEAGSDGTMSAGDGDGEGEGEGLGTGVAAQPPPVVASLQAQIAALQLELERARGGGGGGGEGW
jgi:hypothetical protein